MKPVYGDEQMYRIEIHLPCPECTEPDDLRAGRKGYGTVLYRVPVVNSEGKDYGVQEVECDACGGSGERILTEDYESEAAAQADYPHAISRFIIRRGKWH